MSRRRCLGVMIDTRLANLEPPPYSVESPSQPPTVLLNSNQTTQPAPPPYSAYPVYIPSQPQPPIQIVVESPVQYGSHPMQVFCSECHTLVTTKTVYESGCLTWLSCGLTFILGNFLSRYAAFTSKSNTDPTESYLDPRYPPPLLNPEIPQSLAGQYAASCSAVSFPSAVKLVKM
ncbi:hypothetical protein ACTXT7_004902 [Hymenolepis weldensis]